MPVRKPKASPKPGSKAGGAQTLNLSRSADWDFINEQYARAGMTKTNAPKVFSALAAARKHGAAPRQKAETGDILVPMNAIVSLGFSANGTFASAFSAIPGGTIMSTLILELIDPSTSEVLGTSTVSEFGVGEYLPISVTGGRPSKGNEVEAILTVNYIPVSGGPPVIKSMRMTVSDRAESSPVVGEPVKKTTGSPNLRIALYRWMESQRYDYYYLSRLTDVDLRLPLVGTQRYQSPISKPFDPAISLYLIAPMRGGVAMATAESVAALRKSLKVSGNKLSWTMPWSANPQRDRSVHFGGAAWGEEEVLLVFTIDVMTKKANAPVRTTIISSMPHSKDQPGVETIPAISYSWR